jgi:putative transposase
MAKSSKSKRIPKRSYQQVDYVHLPRGLWRKLRECLPEYKPSKQGGRPRCSDRSVMNALWYVLWTGCQWKALQRDWFGVSASVVHSRFQQWCQQGIFALMMKHLARYYAKRRKISWTWQAIDSKSCPAPLGGEATGKNPTDRAKRGSKIHLLVDKRGAPLAITITGAQCHDCTAAIDLVVSMVVKRPKGKHHLCADKAYDTLEIRKFLTHKGYTPHIKVNPRRAGKQTPEPAPSNLEPCYPARRWVVERTLAWFAKRRSIRTRWTKTINNWLAFVQFAAAHILFVMAVSG